MDGGRPRFLHKFVIKKYVSWFSSLPAADYIPLEQEGNTHIHTHTKRSKRNFFFCEMGKWTLVHHKKYFFPFSFQFLCYFFFSFFRYSMRQCPVEGQIWCCFFDWGTQKFQLVTFVYGGIPKILLWIQSKKQINFIFLSFIRQCERERARKKNRKVCVIWLIRCRYAFEAKNCHLQKKKMWYLRRNKNKKVFFSHFLFVRVKLRNILRADDRRV